MAKRANSRYESGQRSGAWVKMRLNRFQEFIIGGYTVGGSSFDAVLIGHVVDGKAGLRRADAERIHAGASSGIAEENGAAGGRGMPVL